MRLLQGVGVMRTAVAFAALAHTLAADIATFRISNTTLGHPISGTYIGFSLEVNEALQVLCGGDASRPPRVSYARLMTRLRDAAGSTVGPSVRLGGASVDTAAYVPGNASLPSGVTYRVTDAELEAYRAAVTSWNGTLTLGLNFRNASSPELAVAHATAAARVIGWPPLASFEIGNEPELLGGKTRPAGYSYAAYKREFAAYAAALKPVLAGGPGAPAQLRGAVWCCGSFDAHWGDYVAAFGPPAGGTALLNSLSYHRYGVNACGGRKVSIADLLEDSAAEGVASVTHPFAQGARGLPLHIGEGNSASCGGTTGVSDVFASALWALDALLAVAAVGVSRWNIHGGPHEHYAPISYDFPFRGDVATVQPIYYGLLAFASATSGGDARIHAVNATTTNGHIKVWALTNAAGVSRVVVIHKDPRGPAIDPATVRVVPASPGLRGNATLAWLLSGPRGLIATANDDITFSGQTFAGTTDGNPTGDVNVVVLAPVSGTFLFSLPPASAVVITLPRD